MWTAVSRMSVDRSRPRSVSRRERATGSQSQEGCGDSSSFQRLRSPSRVRRVCRMGDMRRMRHADARRRADAIPVETLFKKPQYGGALLLERPVPGGLAQIKDRQAVAVMDLDAHSVDVTPTAERRDRIVCRTNDRMIVTSRLASGTGEPPTGFAVWAADRDGSNARRLTEPTIDAFTFGCCTRSRVRTISSWSKLFRSRYSLDLVRVNTRSGHREMLTFDCRAM